jgi:hypothetical protein
MGIFGDQALRLLREDWANPKMLADELFAIFTSTDPMTLTGPVTIDNTTNQPGLTVRNFGDGNTSMQIQKQPLPPIPPLPPFAPIEFGPISIVDFLPDGTIQPLDAQGNPIIIESGGGGFPGKVLSGGPGSTYKVNVYKKGINQAPISVTATQLQIDPGETIPAGSWCLVAFTNNAYYIQLPVWLDDLPP